MAVGSSDDVDPMDAIATAIEQCRIALGGLIPQAGILISAYESFDTTLVAAVRAAFPGVTVMGSTSAAEISSVSGYLEDSITLALFASDSADVTVGFGAGLGVDVDAACRAAADEALAATRREPRVCVVLADGFAIDPQLTLDAMARALPDGVVIVGGGSARRDLVTMTPTYQFCNERTAQDGVAVLLFSGPVAYSVAVGTGWRALGATGTVTRAKDGLVEEIDGRPAVEFLAPYLDVTGPASFGNPLAVVELGNDRSYLRAIVGSDPTSGALSVFGSVPVGATVQLTTASTDDILTGTREALARAAAHFPAGKQPEAALMFSCMVRKFLLGSRTKVEAELARAQFGASMPLAGLYCAGEIGPIGRAATSRFLNETFVTVLLGT
ncbi:MAG: FIST signal transduction protein [Candidatus Limnocylindrales bacterium]